MTRKARLDTSIPMLAQGYAWLPDRRRAAGRRTVQTRLMGRRALAAEGPEPVVSTPSGQGAVQDADGEPHLVSEAMSVELLTGEGIGGLVDRVTSSWDDAAGVWAGKRQVMLVDEASRVLTRGVCDWAGVPVTDEEVPALARDLTALVDGFATAASRHWRARRVRHRREAWLAQLVKDVRRGVITVPAGSVVDVVSGHRDADGRPLEPRVAAVEILDVLRPAVAVSWFVAFAAHALHRWPANRDRLRSGDDAFATAFAHEVRRFYPFAPFLGGAARAVEPEGEQVPAGSMVLLDLFGQNHDPDLWEEPYTFRPERFLDRPDSAGERVPQGAGDPRTGLRCPGEDITVALLAALVVRLARLEYVLPQQDPSISVRRIPTRPASRLLLTAVRPA
jgi:fatty-acid peroxygenase